MGPVGPVYCISEKGKIEGGDGRGEREWKLDKYEKAKGVQNLLFSEFP